MNEPSNVSVTARSEILGITACMLLVLAAFTPWMSIHGWRFSRLVYGSDYRVIVSPEWLVNVKLAIIASLGLIGLFAGRRWLIIFPSVYGAHELVYVCARCI